MNWWHRLWRKPQMEEQLDKELRFHIEQQTADLIARGYDPEAARRQARLSFGGSEQVKEDCRDARRAHAGWRICGRIFAACCAPSVKGRDSRP